MAMRKKYVRHPELLAADIERQVASLLAIRKKTERKRIAMGKDICRRRTRMIGKRELVANGVRNQAQIGEYLLKKGNENRRISAKTCYKACRGWIKT